MSGRIAHRPNHHSRPYTPPSLRAHHRFLPAHWSYRRQQPALELHVPGYSLALIPVQHRLAHYIVLYQAS
ncbi:hypothetical protein [Tengunoibacter tsumagoiensis]|uniref:Uncharacterized protein n=1 Tax=Tengunoibacter tsumagoiensis TaxID=2014871 RepID=A0A401ZYK5_9CHLR|nr:hypothetical protein [Tengunoibacter tsumagoiensis]GCE11913.1 hypothetical protein KTT_17720 [Tengunoibacter tsumagoiensis]